MHRNTVVTQFFHLNVFRIFKEDTLGMRSITKKEKKKSEPANFPAYGKLGRNFPTAQNSPEKRKILYLIKMK